MTMDRENALYKAAYRAAESHYKDFLANSRRSERENAQGKQMGKEELVQMLTDKFYDKLDKMYPELSTKQEAALLKAEPAKVAKALSFDKDPVADKKIEFSAYKDLLEPKQGDKDWYGLDATQMSYKMQELGYDPQNPDDIKKFYDVLQGHANSYERAKIVNEELNSPAGLASSMLAPSATEEAVKQSLAGEYDDDRMNRAVAIDAVANGIMAAGPLSKVLGGTPLRAGLNAAGAEAGRQTMNLIEGRSFNPAAFIGAGVTAGTVPAMGRSIGGRIAQGASAESRPFARGFARGLRNIDPVADEKEALKASLIAARDITNASIDAAKKGARRYRTKGPIDRGYTEAQMANAEAYDNAARKLSALGFERESSNAFGAPGTPKYSIEEVLGKQPRMIEGRLVYKAPNKRALDAALKEYDKPIEYRGRATTASAIPSEETVLLNRDYRQTMQGAFPAKMEKELATSAPKDRRSYNIGLALGRGVGTTGTQIEPIVRVDPISVISNSLNESVENNNLSKAEKYKNTEWYRKLRKRDPQKAYAIDEALKGIEQ